MAVLYYIVRYCAVVLTVNATLHSDVQSLFCTPSLYMLVFSTVPNRVFSVLLVYL